MKFSGAYACTWALAALTTVAAQATPWVARHLLTPAQYQSTTNDLVSQGYRTTYVTGYTVNGGERYAAIWDKKNGPAWAARHGLTSAQYQQVFNQLVGQGYRPILVNGYTIGGQDRYAAIFDKSPSGGWVARHGLTSQAYQQAWDTFNAQGYRLKHVGGYAVGGEARYAALWEKTGETHALVARHGLTSAQYQSLVNTLVPQGYRVTKVSGYGIGATDYYACILEKKAGPAWVARHGLTSAQYQAEFNSLTPQGYKPTVVDGYTVGTMDRYAAIWEKA